ncbi:DUF2069 domain-containing protein [Halomonas sp. C05BenzN]|uniref:DUF2069 domain-containing protein n=1 Tax=Halomonas sp. C05BenzN TaxID=3411041 RepID=UPI003B946E65
MRQWLEGLEARQGLDHLTGRARRLVLGSYGLLLALIAYFSLVVQRDAGSLAPMVAFALPLVLFLPSLIGRRPRGHAWLAFVSLLYFMKGVMVTTLPGLGWLGLLIAVAALLLFTGCTGYARFRSRQLRAAEAG